MRTGRSPSQSLGPRITVTSTQEANSGSAEKPLGSRYMLIIEDTELLITWMVVSEKGGCQAQIRSFQPEQLGEEGSQQLRWRRLSRLKI